MALRRVSGRESGRGVIHCARRLEAADLLKEEGKVPKIWRPSPRIFWRARSATEEEEEESFSSSPGCDGEEEVGNGLPVVRSVRREKKRR